MNTFTIITKATTSDKIKNNVIVNPSERAFMPAFAVNAVSDKLADSDRAYYAMYHGMDASDYYLIGFEYDNGIYYGITKSLLWGLIPHKNSAKNGGSTCLRFQPNAKMKKSLVEKNAVCYLCDKSEFFAVKMAYNFNFGETFEKLLHMIFKKPYKPNNIPFYEKGDLEVNGIEYNIKFFKGTLNLPKKE